MQTECINEQFLVSYNQWFNVRTVVLRASGPCFNLSRHDMLVYRPPSLQITETSSNVYHIYIKNVQNHVVYMSKTSPHLI